MDAHTIQDIFKSNWVFWLFTQKHWSTWKAICWIVLLPVVIFGVIATVLGEFNLFAGNPLTYSAPIWVGLALVAYKWFTKAFPNAIIIFVPALDTQEDTIIETMRKWAKRLAKIA